MDKFYTPNSILNNLFSTTLQTGFAKVEIIKTGYENIEMARIIKSDGSPFKWDDYTQFDKVVHDAVCSLYENNITEFSRVELWRMITGAKYSGTVSNEMLNDIDVSLQKMFCTGIDLSGKINDKEFRYQGTLISCTSYLEKQNGGITHDIIKVHTIPPLLAYAKLKKQIISFPTSILLLGERNSSFSTIVKHYIIKQIEIFKNGKNYRSNNTILLDTVYRDCDITDKRQKYKVRKQIFSLLDDFKKENYIKNYIIELKGKSFRAIKIETKGN